MVKWWFCSVSITLIVLKTEWFPAVKWWPVLLLLSVPPRQMSVASLSFMVVGTNSPLILLMPEVGLLYILSSSDPLCWGGKGKVKHLETNRKNNTTVSQWSDSSTTGGASSRRSIWSQRLTAEMLNLTEKPSTQSDWTPSPSLFYLTQLKSTALACTNIL